MKNGHGPGEGSKHQQQIAASLIAITPIYRSRIEENGDPDEAEQKPQKLQLSQALTQ